MARWWRPRRWWRFWSRRGRPSPLKLDKTGGLTAALQLAERAEAEGLQIMVGCMMASSLAMAPAFVLAPRAVCLDLDAPLLLARDRDHAIRYEGAMMHPPRRELWG